MPGLNAQVRATPQARQRDLAPLRLRTCPRNDKRQTPVIELDATSLRDEYAAAETRCRCRRAGGWRRLCRLVLSGLMKAGIMRQLTGMNPSPQSRVWGDEWRSPR